MSYSAKYFDGKSSAAHLVEVDFTETSLVISFPKEGEYEEVEWQPAKIHLNEFTHIGPVVLKYGDFPFQYLEVDDPLFSGILISRFPSADFHKSAFKSVNKGGMPVIAGITVVVIACMALIYFFVLPFVAEHIAGTFPMEWEQQLGKGVYEQFILTQEVDTGKTKMINEYYAKLHYDSKYPVEISVIKSGIVNAFALPGGKIVVFDGILYKMKSHEELAALLGHEVSHIELKHSTRNIFRSMAGYIFVSILLGDISGIMTLVAENANTLNNLSYSRSLEQESDKRGIMLMKKNHIDPAGMEKLFKTLKEEEDNRAFNIAEFLSSHPLTDDRIAGARLQIRQKDYRVVPNDTLSVLFKKLTGH